MTKIAEFVQSRELSTMPPDRFDRVKRHVLDTWAARCAGSRTDAGAAVGQLRTDDDLLSDIVVRCAQARCTEIDDIHLTSCTTPGSVVVSTAFGLLASRTAAREATSVRDFCAAVLAGYETLIRLGVAINGPVALRKGVWPTAFAAAFGSAAVAARLLGLSIDQTAGALASSLAFAQQRSTTAAPALSSRWLLLGVAAANGVLAVRGARAGLHGSAPNDALFSGMTRGLGQRFLFDEIGTKPLPTARQGLAAIEAARGIVDAERLTPSDIGRITAKLPEAQRAVVDRAGFPKSRFDSIVNVRYQIALAIVEPERLLDIVRTPPFGSPALRRLMMKIRVTPARDLDSQFPHSWPARVEIQARARRHVRVVTHPLGDARRPLGWAEISTKAVRIASPTAGTSSTERIISEWRATGADATMPHFP